MMWLELENGPQQTPLPEVPANLSIADRWQQISRIARLAVARVRVKRMNLTAEVKPFAPAVQISTFDEARLISVTVRGDRLNDALIEQIRAARAKQEAKR